MRLVLATRNPGKAQELQETLTPLGIEALALDAFDVSPIEETGDSFLENAELKAFTAAKETGSWALGEDSGLEVDALGGGPGVYSARYAGDDANDEANNVKLLGALAGVPRDRRSGRFRTVMVLSSPAGSMWTTEGTCEGTIGLRPRGSRGFGYDPLFIPDGVGRTFAEMSLEEKDAVGHRGQALRKMIAVLRTIPGDDGKGGVMTGIGRA